MSRKLTASQELENAGKKFDEFEKNIKDLTLDRMNQAPVAETEPQTRLSQKDLAKAKDIYLKPKRTYPPGVNPKTGEREKFNERFRDEYNYQREYVCFIAEHNEIRGETIELTLKKFPGTPIEDWAIPVNKPVWAPRMVAERISECKYHRLSMVDRPTNEADGMTFYGTIVADNTVNRLDARPASTNKSIFVGAANF